MLPNTFIVGAAKSGSTTLANMLNSSSNVCYSNVKEPNFHLSLRYKKHASFYSESLSKYESLYSYHGEKIILDASVLYMPDYEYSINSIKSLHGKDVKIIIILRDPLTRAISAYKHSRRTNFQESEDFNSAVLKDSERMHCNPMMRYVYLSDYKPQVEAFEKAFENVLILKTSDLRANREQVAERLSKFLGIDDIDVWATGDGNTESFVWKSNILGRCVNFIFPGNFRKSIKHRFPNAYSKFLRLVISIMGKPGSLEVSVTDSTKKIFNDKKLDIEDYLKEKL